MKLSSTDFLQRDSDFLKVKGKIVEQLENADTCSSSTNFSGISFLQNAFKNFVKSHITIQLLFR